jgi:hypothetical protein
MFERRQSEQRPHRNFVITSAGASMVVLIGGICAGGLAIAGLANAVPRLLMAIATLVFGITLLFEGGSQVARWASLQHRLGNTPMPTGGGTGGAFAAGIAGIVLGILSIIGVAPIVLCSIAIIAFGASLLLGSLVGTGLSISEMERSRFQTTASEVSAQASAATPGGKGLVGLAAVILGILALVGNAPLTLCLVGLLCLGAVILLTGTAVSVRVLELFNG